MPHQLQRHHPPPKPPASLSTVIKVTPLPPPPAHNSLHVEERRGEGRREEERWRNGEVALSGGRLGVRLAGRGSRVTTLTLSLSVSLSPSSLPPPQCRVSQPLLDRCVPDYTTFTTVGDWLDAIKMSRYRDNFVNAGFASFDLVAQMTAE